MPDSLEELWRRIDSGLADEQEKIDTAVRSGESKQERYIPLLVRLLDDEASQVRYYALQSLVLDLRQKDSFMEARCWQLLKEDPGEEVRGMAAACLGSIYLNKRSAHVFRQLLGELEGMSQSPVVKASIYTSLFKLAGRPPMEWPGLKGPARVFDEGDIDWEKIAWLQDQMTVP